MVKTWPISNFKTSFRAGFRTTLKGAFNDVDKFLTTVDSLW